MNEFELIRELLGTDEDEAADEAMRDRARIRLRRAIEAARLAKRRRRRLRRMLPVAAALAVVVAIVVPLVLPSSGPSAAAVELRRLGRIAASGEALHVGRGQYLMMRSDELRIESFYGVVSGVGYVTVSRLRLSTWSAPDGSGYRETEVLSTRFASEADRQAWIDAGRPDIHLERIEHYRPGEAPLHDIRDLPEAPGPLLDALRSGAVAERPPGDEQVFILIGELLAQGDAPPGLRAALFEAASRLEGVELTGEVTDPLGRAGIGVSFAGAPIRTRLVFDPRSSRLLAVELYEEGTNGEMTLSSWTAHHPPTVVDSLPPEA